MLKYANYIIEASIDVRGEVGSRRVGTAENRFDTSFRYGRCAVIIDCARHGAPIHFVPASAIVGICGRQIVGCQRIKTPANREDTTKRCVCSRVKVDGVLSDSATVGKVHAGGLEIRHGQVIDGATIGAPGDREDTRRAVV